MTCTLTRSLAIIALGVIAGGVHSWLSEPFPLRYKPPVQPTEVPSQPLPPVADGGGTKAPEVARPEAAKPPPEAPLGFHITLPQAKALFDKGTIFVDARTKHEFDEGHITGAMHLDPADISRSGIPDKVRNTLLPGGTTIVIYCGGGTCDASENLAARLGEIGVKPMHIFHDGFPAWQAAGYPADNGPDPFEDMQ